MSFIASDVFLTLVRFDEKYEIKTSILPIKREIQKLHLFTDRMLGSAVPGFTSSLGL